VQAGVRRLLLGIVLALALPASAGAAQGDSAAGRDLYGRYCAACHAIGGGAGGPIERQIGAGPLRAQDVRKALAPPLAGVGAQAADFYLRTGYMPLARTGEEPHRRRVELGEQQIANLVAYVASLGPGPAIPHPQPAASDVSQGMALFTGHCAGCHQILGAGGYAGDAIAPSLAHASSTEIAEAVRIGPYVMPRFSHTQLSDAQLNAIIAWVEYARHPDDRGGLAIGRIGPVPEGLVAWLVGAAALVAMCVIIGKRIPRAH
jgi:ubiquinol-cytochrome c reductase cytochrome c subunit